MDIAALRFIGALGSHAVALIAVLVGVPAQGREARLVLRRAPVGVVRTSASTRAATVPEEAAFDEPYNIALQPAIGAPPAGRARGIRRRGIRVGDDVAPAVDFHRTLARAARG